MKKWAVVCSVLAAAGCAKENYVQDCADGTVFPLEISVPGLETKVLNTANEDKVNSLQVFVFRGDGLLEAYDKADKSSVTVQCTSGAKTIVAIANAPAIEDVNTRSEMESKVSALSDNAVGAFVMCGMRSESVSAASGTLSVPVTRLVARVSIQKVTNQLALPQYAKSTIKINRIYLVNAAGDFRYCDAKYGETKSERAYTPKKWYNVGKYSGSDLPSLLSSGDLTSANATKTAPYSTPHYFYCYPNPSSSDTSTGNTGFTRLVVEATIEGKVCYYPINIKGISNNHTYDIKNLVITRIGSESPNVPVSAAAATFEVKVNPWQSGFSDSVTI